jgi:hypothetical protein
MESHGVGNRRKPAKFDDPTSTRERILAFGQSRFSKCGAMSFSTICLHIEAPGSERCSYPIVQAEAGKIGFKFSNLCSWPRERKNSSETAGMPIKLFGQRDRADVSLQEMGTARVGKGAVSVKRTQWVAGGV